MLRRGLSDIVSDYVRDFFYNDTPPNEIYTLSLHDALPIFDLAVVNRINDSVSLFLGTGSGSFIAGTTFSAGDRKSTRLNSSHVAISYAVFCLKKKNKYSEAIAATYPIKGEVQSPIQHPEGI